MSIDFWTQREDAVLEKHYPLGGSAPCMLKLPNRTRQAIVGRANRIKLKSPLINSEASRLGGEASASAARERYYFFRAVRPSHLPGRVKCGSEESNYLCNLAFVKAMREHHPEREVWE